ncbi:MAG TPA: hypothetical protein VIM30_13985 [Candidatus Limnocylindrales bacterium]|jgi:hypothetical protein
MDWTRFRSVAVLATAVMLAACAGTASPNPSTGAPAGSFVEASAAPVASENAAASAAAPAASVDVSNAGQALSNLTSYKVTITTTTGTSTTFSAESVVIRKPTPASSFTETGGTSSFRVVTIGPDIWVDSGTGKYVKNPPGMSAATVAAMTNAFDPGTFLQSLAKSFPIAAVPVQGIEQKNGVSAAHLHADSSTALPAGSSPLPSGATVDVWIATDGNYLVALEAKGLPAAATPGASAATGATSDFTIQVTNINDASLTVSPPA